MSMINETAGGKKSIELKSCEFERAKHKKMDK